MYDYEVIKPKGWKQIFNTLFVPDVQNYKLLKNGVPVRRLKSWKLSYVILLVKILNEEIKS